MNMNFKTFRNIAILVGLCFVLTLGWCTCRSSSTPKPNAVTTAPRYYAPTSAPAAYNPAPVQSAPVYAPSPVPIQQQVAVPDVDTLRNAASAWLQSNPRGYREMSRRTIIAGVRVTAVRFPANDARKFTDNEADWNQLRFDMNGDGRDDEKWLIKFGRISKRELLGGDGKTTVGEPQMFN